jgi:hypothetical protein
VDRFVDGVAAGEPIDREDHETRVRRITARLTALRNRLEVEAAAAERDSGVGDDARPRGDDQRLRDFLEIMTLETPEDPFHKQLRARLFQRVVQRVEVDDSGEGPVTITLYGHLVPETSPLDHANPLDACHDLLDTYAARKGRKSRDSAREGQLRANPQTAKDQVDAMAVWGSAYSRLLEMPGTLARARLSRLAYASTGWRLRRHHQRKDTKGLEYGWKTSIHVTVPERKPSRRRPGGGPR